ncbi:MAG TPA: ATP-binding protein [Sandaracinaceae bacterium LLY-WYZ-13_1]|nr:ATP-binding protein [Sandaracinaceae bacterium LLY-WYZ-13_1]
MGSEFMPHGHCYFWTPDVLWLHVGSDLAIALAYFTIPLALGFFVRRRRDLAFPGIFLLFGAFILACGTTHAFGVWTTWIPDYRIEGWIKAVTALVSVATACVLFPLVPKALALPSPAELRREVEERRRAEESVRELNAELEARVAARTEELERLNEELRQFVHVVSHDLRAPLRAVTGFTQLLEERHAEALGASGAELAAHAHGGARRMQRMLADLVTYARIDAAPPDESPVALGPLVEEVLSDLRDPLEASGAEVEVGEALPTVRGSRTHLHQLLQNLLSNAVKYAGDAPPRIAIDASAEAERLTLRVIDRGVGVPPEQAPRIFEMFQRLHTDEEAEGTGIGLAICRRIAERHGGTIAVEQTPGGGATFRVELPWEGPT